MIRSIAGLRFNKRGVEVTDAEIQATWRRVVLRDRLEALNLDRPAPRCPHGVSIDQAGCGKCEGLG